MFSNPLLNPRALLLTLAMFASQSVFATPATPKTGPQVPYAAPLSPDHWPYSEKLEFVVQPDFKGSMYAINSARLFDYLAQLPTTHAKVWAWEDLPDTSSLFASGKGLHTPASIACSHEDIWIKKTPAHKVIHIEVENLVKFQNNPHNKKIVAHPDKPLKDKISLIGIDTGDWVKPCTLILTTHDKEVYGFNSLRQLN